MKRLLTLIDDNPDSHQLAYGYEWIDKDLVFGYPLELRFNQGEMSNTQKLGR